MGRFSSGSMTVFTPTFNRAYILGQLYSSLQRQTDQDFTWLVVDDDSNDGTEALIRNWQRDSSIEIVYYRQQHGGKHRAINYAVNNVQTEFLFIVDSDDFLADDAVAQAKKYCWPIRTMAEIGGVYFCRGHYLNGHGVIGGEPKFPKDTWIDATLRERREYNCDSDRAEVYKVSLLKKYPFPEYQGEDFLTEGVVWQRIAADGIKMRWVNRIIYYGEYREDGLSHNSYRKFQHNPRGWADYIVIARACGEWLNEEDLYVQYLRFYEVMYRTWTLEQMAEALRINIDIIRFTAARQKKIIKFLRSRLGASSMPKVAIYGSGVNGQRLFQYLQALGINTAYVIDRQFTADFCEKTFTPSEKMPKVDFCLVSPKRVYALDFDMPADNVIYSYEIEGFT